MRAARRRDRRSRDSVCARDDSQGRRRAEAAHRRADAALAAAIVYGRAMRAAWKAPLLSNNRAPYERASAFLVELTGAGSSRRTEFGEALHARYPRAVERLLASSDALSGFEEEAVAAFPDLVGGCE